MASLEKNIKIIDKNGKVLAELSKILKDVTVDEFKKILTKFNPFRKYLLMRLRFQVCVTCDSRH